MWGTRCAKLVLGVPWGQRAWDACSSARPSHMTAGRWANAPAGGRFKGSLKPNSFGCLVQRKEGRPVNYLQAHCFLGVCVSLTLAYTTNCSEHLRGRLSVYNPYIVVVSIFLSKGLLMFPTWYCYAQDILGLRRFPPVACCCMQVGVSQS